ncbi:hypothetical protein J5X84_10285 [Streptosporangiaceae bacterium NEAU-GS5]|nr:hypothetical protein [Streptosporangiaceae bacterium NEAU-GS5]
MKRTLAIGGLIATAGLLAAGLAAPAQAAPAGSTKVGPTVPAKDAQSVIKFWSWSNGKALRDAKQYHPDYVVKTHTARLKSTGAPAADGKAGIVAPIGEEGKAAAKIKNINLPKTIGKVFFVRDGHTYWCSATSVQSHYHNLVATAGHCVYNTDDNDHVLDKWVFVPGYYQGKAPWGIYAAKQAFTHYDFDVYEDYDRDYAFVTVYNGLKVTGVVECSQADATAAGVRGWNFGGKWWRFTWADAGRLGDNVGGQGFAYNIKAGQNVFVFSYPAGEHPDGDKPYSGITPKWVYGKTAKTVVDSSLKIEEQIAVKGALTYGADGGPWLYRYSNTKRTGYVNGVVSTFIDNDGNGRYDYVGSPFFDGETYGVYAAAANVWSGSIA